MSRIRGKDRTPEKSVRSLLHKMGFRFRLHVKIPISPTRNFERGARKPGQLQIKNLKLKTATRRFITPDIVLMKQRVGIFGHGCFWHRPGCKNCTT